MGPVSIICGLISHAAPSPKHRWWFVAERGMEPDGVVVMAATDCGAIYAAWVPAFENVA
jgi:hypothetical protein